MGKTVNVRNTVTGQRFEILYGADGPAPGHGGGREADRD